MSMAIIGVAGVVVGAGAGIYSASQAGKGSGQTRSLGEVGQMPVGDYEKQLRSLVAAQQQYDQSAFDANLANLPALGAAQRDQQRAGFDLLLEQYPRFAKAERKSTSAQRGGDLADLAAYGGGYKAQLGALSPGYANLDSIGQEIGAGDSPLLRKLNMDAIGAGHSQIRDQLDSGALSDLALGRSLTPEQERDSAQASRAAWSARGLGNSNGAVAAEILNRDVAAAERERQRRLWAAQVMGLDLGEDASNRTFGLNVENQNAASRAARVSQSLAIGQGQLSPILGALAPRATASPYALLGASAPVPVNGPASIWGQGPQITGAANALAPLYSYGQNIFDTNFNAAEARNINQANAYASVGSGIGQSGGAIAAAAIKANADKATAGKG